MIETRILPPEEWPRLNGTEAETLWPKLSPETSSVIVVEEDGKIIATWTLLTMVHVECLWIAPESRGSFGVTRRLLAKMREIAVSWRVSSVITGSLTGHVTNLIERLGGSKLPGEFFVLPIGQFGTIRKRETEQCQQL